MKKIIALILAMAMALALVACGGDNSTNNDAQDGNTPAANGTTVYVLGPTPDHGWTAQAGAYAQAKCDEITAAGEYKAVYMPASSGEEQVDQVNTIIANGDAAIVVMMALDDSAQAGQEALHAENIPFISFDRIIEATEAYAVLNASGDNWQCGRGIAYWLQKNGMKPGDTIVTLYGDNGTVCSRRAEGFKEFLTGAEKYSDKALGQDFETTEVWDEAAVDAALNTYGVQCHQFHSADGAGRAGQRRTQRRAGGLCQDAALRGHAGYHADLPLSHPVGGAFHRPGHQRLLLQPVRHAQRQQQL